MKFYIVLFTVYLIALISFLPILDAILYWTGSILALHLFIVSIYYIIARSFLNHLPDKTKQQILDED